MTSLRMAKQVAVVFVNLTQARVTWDESRNWENASLRLAVGKCPWAFLQKWWMWCGRAQLTDLCYPWAGSPGLSKTVGRVSHEEQANKQHPSMVSASVPALTFLSDEKWCGSQKSPFSPRCFWSWSASQPTKANMDPSPNMQRSGVLVMVVIFWLPSIALPPFSA